VKSVQAAEGIRRACILPSASDDAENYIYASFIFTLPPPALFSPDESRRDELIKILALEKLHVVV